MLDEYDTPTHCCVPYNLHIVKPSDFIRLDGRGKVDVEHSHSVLVRLAKECVERNIDHALLDVRGAHSEMGLSDLYRLARAFPEMGFTENHRLAILHKYNAGERAEVFAMFAAERGWNVRTFDNYEEAIEWFSSDEPLGPRPGA